MKLQMRKISDKFVNLDKIMSYTYGALIKKTKSIIRENLRDPWTGAFDQTYFSLVCQRVPKEEL